MNIRRSAIATALAIAVAAPASALDTMSSADAHELLLRAGFSSPSELIYADGAWQTRATSPDGERVNLRIDPDDREIRVTRSATDVHILTTERRLEGTDPARTVTRMTVVEDPGPVRVIEAEPVRVETRVVEGPTTEVEVVPTRVEVVPAEVEVVPVTTRVVRPPITAPEVEVLLADAGYRGVHDIEFRNGAWKAEAYEPGGDDVEIIMDPDSGRILQVMDD